MNTTLTHKPELLIGLVGQAGSGKDTVADMLVTHWLRARQPSARLSFALPIRYMLFQFLEAAGVLYPALQMTERDLKEAEIPGLGVSYRHLAQTLGTEWGQQCVGRDVWIKLLERQLCKQMDHGTVRFVVTDTRFGTEADWIRAQGGVIWRIDRPGLAPVREHATELGMEQIRSDRVILNDGSLEDLQRTVGLELARLHYEQGLAS